MKNNDNTYEPRLNNRLSDNAIYFACSIKFEMYFKYRHKL